MRDFYFSFGKRQPSDLRTAINWAVLWVWLDPLLDFVVGWVNRKVLSRLDGKAIKDVFDELDRFWLRNAQTKSYSESEIRVIIAMMVRAAFDSELSREELVGVIDYIQRKWAPDVALAKEFSITDEVVDARVEAVVDQAIDLYEKTYEERPLTPEEFVASTAEIIYHAPDGSKAQDLLGGAMEIKNKLIY